MEAFEIIVKNNSYKVIRDAHHSELLNVFNHTIYFIIKKNGFVWEIVEHRFGGGDFPIDLIGDQIDQYYDYRAYGAILKEG